MDVAVFSDCRKYRYTLWRSWHPIFVGVTPTNYANFICLNPSTADETKDDPTVRKCVRLAKRWGLDAMCITNLFAFRATAPKVMKGCDSPVGPENDGWISRIARDAEVVICAWGRHGSFLGRSEEVLKFLDPPVHYLRMGELEPYHPLYLSDNSMPMQWHINERLAA